MPDKDLVLPDTIKIKDLDGVIQSVLNMCRDVRVIGKCGHTNLSGVKCNTVGLTLGHWYDLWDALGPDVTMYMDSVNRKEMESNVQNSQV